MVVLGGGAVSYERGTPVVQMFPGTGWTGPGWVGSQTIGPLNLIGPKKKMTYGGVRPELRLLMYYSQA